MHMVRGTWGEKGLFSSWVGERGKCEFEWRSIDNDAWLNLRRQDMMIMFRSQKRSQQHRKDIGMMRM